MGPSPSTGRGQYDRTVTPSQRAHEQRALIYDTALALLGQPHAATPHVNLDELCRLTRLGRNTVYGLFESATLLPQRVLDEALQRLLESVQQPLPFDTPVNGLRSFAERWVACCAEHAPALPALLSFRRDQLRAALRVHLERLLHQGAVAGAFAAHYPSYRLPVLAEAFLASVDSRVVPAESNSQAIAAGLADLAVRVVR